MYAQCPKPSKPYISDANHFLSNKALVKHDLRAVTNFLNILKFRIFFGRQQEISTQKSLSGVDSITYYQDLRPHIIHIRMQDNWW